MSDISELTKHLLLRPVAGGFRPLSAQQLVDLEAKIGAAVPDDYRAFLLKYGRCGMDGVVDVVPPEGGHVSILQFFGAPEPGRADDLFWHLDTYRDELPAGCVVIGDDVFGNPFVLDAESGRVVFFDHEGGEQTPRLVADTFGEFLRRIEVTPDE